MGNPNPSSSSSPRSGPKGKPTTPCCSKVGLKRGPWTPEEDDILSKFVKKEGEGRWRTLPKRAGLLRCGKSCRLRWMNYLRPSIKHGPIASDEEDLILRLHRLLGNRWSLIAGRIPGRTDNEIKNYWNTYLSKKLISQGIDPRTHKPLNLNNPNPNPNDLQTPIPPANPNPTSSELNSSCYLSEIDINSGEDTALMDCYPEDDFSSFLDSLINDDVFVHQQNNEKTSDQDVNAQFVNCTGK
ncbi:uncharacterized protein A4U43_C01F20360 [Asparagus officinalis]|uniref:Uncharacterized protein n=1 Tax=Asparagus officinalis TaxID=4686 RepID=A0A5P1FQU1_ASPOF|nr:transcription repressor MYB5-like [Asparagus officinalis]ONK80666.1 uncharacterized protein A4U43_C01F20360 [Asparagus officinalis]